MRMLSTSYRHPTDVVSISPNMVEDEAIYQTPRVNPCVRSIGTDRSSTRDPTGTTQTRRLADWSKHMRARSIGTPLNAVVQPPASFSSSASGGAIFLAFFRRGVCKRDADYQRRATKNGSGRSICSKPLTPASEAADQSLCAKYGLFACTRETSSRHGETFLAMRAKRSIPVT